MEFERISAPKKLEQRRQIATLKAISEADMENKKNLMSAHTILSVR
jgi:hypothetical protein